ncbi:hypothetical protein FPV67DRAFT_1672538 [Lyophyllum atratum]|nr:hypothetical protein FPV67DRAFT_1672538 [Lyophyllum atratum]
MSYRHASATSTTTMTSRSSANITERPEVTMWAKSQANHDRVSEAYFRECCEKKFGTVEKAMIMAQEGDAYRREAYAQAAAQGLIPPPIHLGAKPGQGEKVDYAQLNSRVWLRIWGDSLASIGCYSFDFVDRNGQYMSTPPGIKIYCETTGAEVRSIEASLDAVAAKSKEFKSTLEASYAQGIAAGHTPNAQWETYIVQEGTMLRIKQGSRPNDLFLTIPTRTPTGDKLTLVSRIVVHWLGSS